MGKAAAARKLASAAAFGGGGLSVLGAGLYGVLRGEAALARRMIGNADDPRFPDSTGWYGRGRPGPAIKVALLGDSSAAGYGVDRIVETPGAFFASGLAAEADRRVHLRTFAKVGAQSSDLAGQIDRALPSRPDLAVDPDRRQRRHPPDAPRRSRCATSPTPYAGWSRPTSWCWSAPAPTSARSSRSRRRSSRWPARGRGGWRPRRRSRWSRRAAVAVSLGSILGPDFAAAPAVLFGPDQFHPSAAGLPRASPRCWCPVPWTRWASAPTSRGGVRRGEGTMPVAAAAVRAARTPGTELGDKKGLWVELRRRARLRSDPEAPRRTAGRRHGGQRRMIARSRSRLV